MHVRREHENPHAAQDHNLGAQDDSQDDGPAKDDADQHDHDSAGELPLPDVDVHGTLVEHGRVSDAVRSLLPVCVRGSASAVRCVLVDEWIRRVRRVFELSFADAYVISLKLSFLENLNFYAPGDRRLRRIHTFMIASANTMEVDNARDL
ncbi:MAG: hypothetical protein Q9175_002565 [Cornicularia normoerica]